MRAPAGGPARGERGTGQRGARSRSERATAAARDGKPQTGNRLADPWAALARDSLADGRGEPHAPYLTFSDGWRYQEASDASRAGGGWRAIPA